MERQCSTTHPGELVIEKVGMMARAPGVGVKVALLLKLLDACRESNRSDPQKRYYASRRFESGGCGNSLLHLVVPGGAFVGPPTRDSLESNSLFNVFPPADGQGISCRGCSEHLAQHVGAQHVPVVRSRLRSALYSSCRSRESLRRTAGGLGLHEREQVRDRITNTTAELSIARSAALLAPRTKSLDTHAKVGSGELLVPHDGAT